MTRLRAAVFGAAIALCGAVTACDSSGGSAASDVPASVAARSSRPVPAPSATLIPTVPATSSTARPSRTARSTARPAPSPTTTAATATREEVVRPVTSDGSVVAGWSVRVDTTTIDCSGALRSPVSQSADVLFCAPSAASATACWHAARRDHAYCLLDPREHALVEYRLQGSAFPAARPVEVPPAPASLDLADGTRCEIRDGGAAARLTVHPDWIPYFFCGTDASVAVWAPQGAADSGVARGDGPWQVQLAAGNGTGNLRAVGVATAVFVGTA